MLTNRVLSTNVDERYRHTNYPPIGPGIFVPDA